MTQVKSNRILSMLLALMMVLSLGSMFSFTSTTAYAEELDGHWKYNVVNGKATIIQYLGTDKEIAIPAKVGGYQVARVEKLIDRDYLRTEVKSVRFAEGIAEIGNSVFENATSLKIITFPSTLRQIGKDAFAGCTSLTGIALPNMVSYIGDNAFKNCTSLKTANLNCAVTELRTNTFFGCTSLANVTLPNSLTKIENGVFEGCGNLSVINLPNGVKEIGESAFEGCRAITGSLTLPAEIKTIDNRAFALCTGLTKVVIPNTIKDIKAEAFYGCSRLETVLIGEGLIRIGENIFRECSHLTKIAFGGKYVKLDSALRYNSSIASIYYPASRESSWKEYKTIYSQSYTSPSNIKIKGSKSITAGASTTLTVTCSPNTASFGKAYYFVSSAPHVATVNSEGVVKAISAGEAKITVHTLTGSTKSFTITVKPKKVQSVKAESQTTSSAKISWHESDTSVAGYMVYRSTSKNGSYKNIGTTYKNEYIDKGLTKGKTYYYKVYAYIKLDGETIKSAASTPKKVTITSPAPSYVTAKRTKSKTVKITWGKAISAQGYEVYMATSRNGKYTKIKTVSNGSTTSFTKTKLTSGKTYYFKVRSYITVNGKKVYSGYTTVTSCKA